MTIIMKIIMKAIKLIMLIIKIYYMDINDIYIFLYEYKYLKMKLIL